MNIEPAVPAAKDLPEQFARCTARRGWDTRVSWSNGT